MPNRVDGTVSGVHPTIARAPEREATRPEEAVQRADAEEQAPDQGDRVEVSTEVRAQVQEQRTRVGEGQENPRGAALNAPGARQNAAGEQGAVEGATANRAQELRDQQETARQQNANRPPERQGNLVDVVG